MRSGPGGSIEQEKVADPVVLDADIKNAPKVNTMINIVLSRSYVTRINPGDYMFMIGDMDTATC